MYLTTYSKYANRGRALQATIRARGYTSSGHRVWSEKEDAICRAQYPDYRRLEKLLPDRTLLAIKTRCRNLGIRKKVPSWTGQEHSRFRRGYSTLPMDELATQFPHRTREALHARGRLYRIARPKKPYKKTGNYLLDELRQECQRRNITMPDLDQFACSRRYFTNKGWSGARGSFKYQAIVAGILALGGKLSVTWEDEE